MPAGSRTSNSVPFVALSPSFLTTSGSWMTVTLLSGKGATITTRKGISILLPPRYKCGFALSRAPVAAVSSSDLRTVQYAMTTLKTNAAIPTMIAQNAQRSESLGEFPVSQFRPLSHIAPHEIRPEYFLPIALTQHCAGDVSSVRAPRAHRVSRVCFSRSSGLAITLLFILQYHCRLLSRSAQCIRHSLGSINNLPVR
jgi:hypothetical protein